MFFIFEFKYPVPAIILLCRFSKNRYDVALNPYNVLLAKCYNVCAYTCRLTVNPTDAYV